MLKELVLFVNVEVRGEESLLLVSFVNEVVNSGDLVVLIIINALLGVVGLEPELLDHLQDLGLGRDRVLPDDQSLVLADRLVLLEPPVPPDVHRRETGLRVRVQNFRENVSPVLRHKLG